MSPHEMIRHLTRCRRCMGRGIVDLHCTNLEPHPGVVHLRHPERTTPTLGLPRTWCGRTSFRTDVVLDRTRPHALDQVTCRYCLLRYRSERRRSPGDAR